MDNEIYTKEHIIEKLRPVFQGFGIHSATLFGSYASGQATAASDVDLYVDSHLRGLKFVGLVEAIRKALGNKPVDVLDKMHVETGSKVFDEISNTGILIYEG